jgi:hypothetical protein
MTPRLLSSLVALVGCASLLAVASCSSRAANVPYDPSHTTVIDPTGMTQVVNTPSGNSCLVLADGPHAACIMPQTQCAADETAQVVVDGQGNVIDVVCLPPVAPGGFQNVVDGGVPQNANNTVITFGDPPGPDGGNTPSYSGDLNVDGNNVTLYGDDPATSTLDGNLTVDGNNTIVRGITITGDVTITKNDATFVYCVIRGNVTIPANNTVITGCEIWGDISVTGNNTVLHGNRIGGDVQGHGLDCQENYSFEDKNHDGVIQSSEVGEPISC